MNEKLPRFGTVSAAAQQLGKLPHQVLLEADAMRVTDQSRFVSDTQRYQLDFELACSEIVTVQMAFPVYAPAAVVVTAALRMTVKVAENLAEAVTHCNDFLRVVWGMSGGIGGSPELLGCLGGRSWL